MFNQTKIKNVPLLLLSIEDQAPIDVIEVNTKSESHVEKDSQFIPSINNGKQIWGDGPIIPPELEVPKELYNLPSNYEKRMKLLETNSELKSEYNIFMESIEQFRNSFPVKLDSNEQENVKKFCSKVSKDECTFYTQVQEDKVRKRKGIYTETSLNKINLRSLIIGSIIIILAFIFMFIGIWLYRVMINNKKDHNKIRSSFKGRKSGRFSSKRSKNRSSMSKKSNKSKQSKSSKRKSKSSKLN